MERLALACISLLLFFPSLAGAQTKPEVTGPHTWRFSSNEMHRCAPNYTWQVPMIHDSFNYPESRYIYEVSLNITHPNNSSGYFMVNGLVKAYQESRDGNCLNPIPVSATGNMISMGFSHDGFNIPAKHYELQLRLSGGGDIGCYLDATTLSGPCYSDINVPGTATFVPK